MERKPSAITVIIIAIIWVLFLVGIIGYKPYMDKYTPKEKKQIEQQVKNEIEGETAQ